MNLYDYLPQLSGDVGLWFLYSLIAIAISLIGYAIYWNLKYKTVYSDIKEDVGIVDDMEYTPSKSTYNAATKSTTYTSEKNEVIVKFEKMGVQEYDSDKLYQRVRIDDKVTAKYVEKYRVERDNPYNRVLTSYVTKSVTSPTGRTVSFE
jgi:hypothetical protein